MKYLAIFLAALTLTLHPAKAHAESADGFVLVFSGIGSIKTWVLVRPIATIGGGLGDLSEIAFGWIPGAPPANFGFDNAYRAWKETTEGGQKEFDHFKEELKKLSAVVPGDANFDDNVDFADFLIVSANYGMSSGPSIQSAWTSGDFNLDGTVNFDDFLILSTYYD